MRARQRKFLAYLAAPVLVGASVLFRNAILGSTGEPESDLLLSAVAIAGALGGIGPALVATALSLLEEIYFQTEPVRTFLVPRHRDQVELTLFLASGVAIAITFEILRRLRQREATVRRTLLMITRCNEAILRARTEEQLYADICHVIVDVGGYRMCWVGLAEQDERRTVRPVAHAGHEDGYLGLVDIIWADEPRGRGTTGTAIRERRMVVGQDFSTDPSMMPWRVEAHRRGYRSVTSLPLLREGEVLGAIVMYSREAAAFTGDELGYLAKLTDDVAFGVTVLRQAQARERAVAEKRRAEHKSEERERFLANVLATSLDAFWVVDTTGQMLEVNDAACSMLGFTQEELLARNIGDVEDAMGAEEIASRMESLLRTGGARFESRHHRKDGGVIEVDVSATLVPYDGGRVVAFIRDVTDRRRAEEALQRAQRTLLLITRCGEAILRGSTEEEMFGEVCRVIVETGGYRMAWVGTAENDEHKTVRPVAHAGHEAGYLRDIDVVWADEPRGRGPTGTAIRENRIVVGPDFADEPMLRPWSKAALERGYKTSTAVPLVHGEEKVGVITMYSGDPTVWTDDELGLLRQMADDLAFGVQSIRRRVARDQAVAGRASAVQALSTEQERFQRLIERSSDLTLVLDRRGRIQFASPACQEILGLSPTDLAGSEALDHIHPEDHTAARKAMAEVLTPSRASSRVELRVRRLDGAYALVDSNLRNLLDVPGIEGVVVNNRDVTERNRLREQFQQAQKLESIGRLAGGVAHDFNNLLTVILACGEDVRRSIQEGAVPDPDCAGDILDAAHRASDVTKQLLSFARKQVIHPAALDLNKVIRASEKLLRRVIGADVQIVTRLQPDLWTVWCDAGLIDQVTVNLVVNARDAMPGGGKVILATRNVAVRSGDPVPDPEMVPGPYVVLTVEDSGTGMPPEVLRHIFEPFFTTKEQGKGTGLGLATVFGIVKQSRGFLGVRSSVGVGTTFEIYLPRHEAPPSDAEDDVQRVGGTETILLVEDEPRVRDVTARMLRSGGYRVLSAAGGEEATAIARDEKGAVALLVTDTVLPGMGGREVARRITELAPGVRILLVSGYAGDEISGLAGLDDGANFLPKPFSTADLLKRVREILDGGSPVPPE